MKRKFCWLLLLSLFLFSIGNLLFSFLFLPVGIFLQSDDVVGFIVETWKATLTASPQNQYCMNFKKVSLLLLLLTGIFMMFNCRHELPVSCAELNFKIAITKTDALLNNSNGTITATATGGDVFKYSLNGAAFQDSGYFAGLASFGKFKIVGINSAGCTDTVDVSIGSYNPCQGIAINVAATKVDAAPNKTDGSIAASASGGTGFNYSINGGAFQSAGLFANLGAGVYTIAARTAAGCLGTTQVTVGTTDPCAGISVTISAAIVQPTLNQSNGSITASATGGSGFTYSINNGAFQAGGTFSGLAAGNYTITAKNSIGCTGAKQVALIGADPCAGITVVVASTQVDPTTGSSNGTITASATGGAGFTYSLNNGAFQAGTTFNGLLTGNYTLTAKNSNGCMGVKQVTLGANNPCAGITVTVSNTQVNPATGVSNGSIVASATGGSGFTFSLNNGAYQASATFSNLAAGTYTINAKNSNGCLGVKQVSLNAIDPCAGVTVVVAASPINPSTGVSNGSITASATGSTGFTYSINNGAYQASGIFANLAAGSYTISAKSSSGCLGSKIVTLIATNPCTNVNIVMTAAVVNTTPCKTPINNGSITITASGSTGLSYNIIGGAYQAGNVFAGLNAATYLMGVKDANGCTKILSVIVGVVPAGPLFAAVRSLISTKCSGNGCHMNGTATKGYNFDSDCSVLTYWSQINGACVTGTLARMPISPQTALTAAQKASITSWINAGHQYNQ